MKAKTKVILGSAMTVAMCASLIAGSTFALFTSESKTNIAITSGKVDVEAQIDEGSLQLYTIQGTAEGEKSYADKGATVFPITGGTASFGSETAALSLANFVPGNGAEFDITVTNSSSVSVLYRFGVTLTGDPALYQNISYAVSTDEGPLELINTIGANACAKWSKMEPTEGMDGKTIHVGLEFDFDATEPQAANCTFTFSVLAMQGNAQAEDPTPATADSVSLNKPEDLAILREMVENGFTGNVTLLSDLDFGGGEFAPIGSAGHPFTGTFDGKGHTIENFAITEITDQEYVGMFAYTAGETSIKDLAVAGAKVDNLNHLDENSKQDGKAGVLVGLATGDITVDNVQVYGEIAANKAAAGFIAYTKSDSAFNVVIRNSENHAAIRAPKGNGFVSQVDKGTNLTIETCKNYGDISLPAPEESDVTGRDVVMGGFCGYLQDNTVFVTIVGCRNFGNFNVKTDKALGKCNIGGIISTTHGSTSITITDTVNEGDIDLNYGNSSADIEIGGLIGSGKAQFTDVQQLGDITVVSSAGGLVAGLVGDSKDGSSFAVSEGNKNVLKSKISVTNNSTQEIACGIAMGNGSSVTIEQGDFTVTIDPKTEYVYGLFGKAAGTYEIKNTVLNVEVSDGYYTVYQWDGAGVVTEPGASVSNAAGMKYFRGLVESGTDFSKKTVSLANDIDLNNEPWTPIGTDSAAFNGTFDGNCHTIRGLYGTAENFVKVQVPTGMFITTASDGWGLFGNTAGKTASTLANVKLKGKAVFENVSGTNFLIGALAAAAHSNISNVWSDVDITVSGATGCMQYVGGIAGVIDQGCEVRDCLNSGDITMLDSTGGAFMSVGGIAGGSRSSITYSVNVGTVQQQNCSALANLMYVCGIMGYSTAGTDATGTPKDCYTEGGAYFVAGMQGIQPGTPITKEALESVLNGESRSEGRRNLWHWDDESGLPQLFYAG